MLAPMSDYNTPRLELRHTQTLTMTPQLQQAIKLLQMTNLELGEYLESEISMNPFLEKADGTNDGDFSDSSSSGSDSGSHDFDTVNPPDTANANDRGKTGRQEEALDTDYSNVWNNGGESEANYERVEASEVHDTMPSMAGVGAGGNSKFTDAEFSLENRLSGEETLIEHIEQQIHIELDTPQEQFIALTLMEGLEDTGYFTGDIAAMAKRLNAKEKDILAVLKQCQTFSPAGVFARNLQECLRIQIEDRGELTPKMALVLDNLDFVGRHDLAGMAKACKLKPDELKDALGLIRTLNPKPALEFAHFTSQTVVPDVLVRKNTDKTSPDTWIVEINPDTLPRALVNQRYIAMVSSQKLKGDDKKYVTEKINSANWLVRAMDQRRQTILKVGAEIVKQQEAFMNYGIEYLRPLVLRDIASTIDMHESTVSRVTTGKYINTPRGVYEMKFFFSSGVGGGAGSMEFAAEAVKARIKDLIDKENPKKILSDDKLVSLLKDEGIDIARRTVAKYREAMNIGSSVERRRAKNIAS